MVCLFLSSKGVFAQSQPEFCIQIYRQDVLQWWTVDKGSFLCNLNLSSTDPDKLGLQAENSRFYISSKFDNLSINDYWLTERGARGSDLGVFIYRNKQKAPIYFSFNKTQDSFRIGSNMFVTSGQIDSTNRTIYFVGENDLVLRAGESSYLINCLFFGGSIVVLVGASAILQASGFGVVFLCSYFIGNAIIQGTVEIAYSSSLITLLALSLVMCSFIAVVNYRLNIKPTKNILIAFLFLFFVFSVHFKFAIVVIACNIPLLFTPMVARYYTRKKMTDLDDSFKEDMSPITPFVEISIFYSSVLWISLSLLWYFPGELTMRFKSSWLYYTQFEAPPALYIFEFGIPLSVALSILAGVQASKLAKEQTDEDDSYMSETKIE